MGSSGAILSYIMCKAMNRSFISVIAGGFGTDGAVSSGDEEMGEYRETTAEDVAELLKNSSSVIITPGYGMAVARHNIPSPRSPRNCVIWGLRCASVSTRLPGVCRAI